MPFGYPKRVFNNFPLRDLSDLMVIDGAGNRNGHILVADFLGDLNVLSTFRLAPHIKRKGESCFSHT